MNVGNVYHSQPIVHKGGVGWFGALVIAVVSAVLGSYFDCLMPLWTGSVPQTASEAPGESRADAAEDDGHDRGHDRQMYMDFGGIGPQDMANQLDGVSVASLNQSRLAGKWVRHEDGSYGWATHAVSISLPVPGRGTLTNASDSLWVWEE